ncbi:dTDP-4-dehydrorhamnose reductase [Mangrovactinospora gilvigrisea]|uniref:dTDP-4-dehydrorhamnose reductase n=2 Tax=Mangrovactinospora gilvigrisea TaxID=1428644 RepID=A0A1J7BF55_9ACTN|nr:dTDP-4-dehydrorhamnose reductase [Mangrovactinospora gilvigrisea]
MLGRDVLARLAADAEPALGLARADLDLTDAAAVLAALERHRAKVVVNCAAWTAVDAAEEHEAEALAVNGDGARNLAAACAAVGARLLHVSTDYVFRGDAGAPYAEDAAPDPVTAYGRTKLAGERAVLEALPEDGSVVRVAWLYGAHGKNFVKTMLRLEGERERLTVVDDQRGQPTWTADVADRLVRLGRLPAADAAGVWHATSSGETTWCGFAREVFRLAGADPERVGAITSADFPTPAKRPAYSVLGHDRWKSVGIDPIRDWREALAEAFPHL